jgi:hypothetical protein
VVDGGGREWRRWRRDADGRRGRLHILQVSAHHSGARLVRLEDGDSSAMILPDGVWRRLLLLLDRADRQLVKLVPHPLGCTPPKHLLGQQPNGNRRTRQTRLRNQPQKRSRGKLFSTWPVHRYQRRRASSKTA